MNNTTEERLAGIEVAVKYLSEQMAEMKQTLSDIQKSLIAKQTLNGKQDVSIAKLQTQISQHDEDIKKLSENVGLITKKVYWLIGILSTLQIVFQLIKGAVS